MVRHLRVLGLIPVMSLLLLLSACATTSAGSTGTTGGSGGGGGGGGATPTATPTPCATHATASALVYADGPNVAGDIPAPSALPLSPAPALSNFTYPLGIPDENAVGNAPTISFTAVSPDALHLAVAIQQIVPFTAEYNPFIVDTGTHAVTKVPLSQPVSVAASGIPPRLFAWADTHTLIIFADPPISNRTPSPTGLAYTYDINTHALTPLHGISGAIEGVVRCSTLFYLSIGSFSLLSPSDPNHTMVAQTYINRYDLSSNTMIGSPVNIGQASTFGGSEGQVDYAGWDVSPDGHRIVFQHESVTAGPTITSSWHAANPDGSAAITILPAATAQNGVRMAISPNGTQVAVTQANPSPDVLSGPISGGPTVFYDSPDAQGQPAWLANNSGFFASSVETYTPDSVLFYTPCGAAHCTGTPAVAKADNPATLP